jgi:hypothetical protein
VIDVLRECRHPLAWSREEIVELYPADFAGRLVSGMSDAIVYADAEGVIRLRIFGFAEAEALGRSLDLIIPENLADDAGHMIGIAAIMRDATTRFEELRALRRQLALQSAADRSWPSCYASDRARPNNTELGDHAGPPRQGQHIRANGCSREREVPLDRAYRGITTARYATVGLPR